MHTLSCQPRRARRIFSGFNDTQLYSTLDPFKWKPSSCPKPYPFAPTWFQPAHVYHRVCHLAAPILPIWECPDSGRKGVCPEAERKMAGTLHTKEYKDLVSSLVQARRCSGLSQAELARRIGRPPSFVAKVELCERRLDIIEFCVWASNVSDDPLTLLSQHLGRMAKKIPS